MTEQDRNAAAMSDAELIRESIGWSHQKVTRGNPNMGGLRSQDYRAADQVIADLERDGFEIRRLTAPDAPSGPVCISRETANWASWALTGVLADNPELTVIPAVREARDEIYDAIEAAAEGGPD